MFFLFLISAFDFVVLNGMASGLGAGAGVSDWRNALVFNPASAVYISKIVGTLVYTRPYGLEGLDCLRTDAGFRVNRFGIVVGMQSVGTTGYNEYDISSGFGFGIVKGFTGGVGVHTLIRNIPGYGLDLVPAFDCGVLGQSSTVRFGAAVLRLNKPELDNGDVLMPKFRCGISWEPVKVALLAVDFEKHDEIERLMSGIELRIFPELKVRVGFETAPWCLRAGLGLNLNWLNVDYGYHYHPEIGDTHIIGMSFSWK